MGAAGGSRVLLLLLLGVAVVTAVTQAPPAQLLAEVLFCQGAAPTRALQVTLSGERLYGFGFAGSRWAPARPQLPPWPPALEPPGPLLRDAAFCQDLRGHLTRVATGRLPEARGVPVADVFPMEPPTLGDPNTLVCMVGNIFPPALRVTWQLNGVTVTQGVTHTPYTPTEDLAFTRFSYLRVTPASGDVYTCVVTRQGDNSSTVAYWVPQTPVPTEELEMALCGATITLGVLLAVLGVAMIVVTRRSDDG